MKQFLDDAQTVYLQAKGFPPPKSVCKLSLDMDMDTVPHFGYSIGELLDLLPKCFLANNDRYKLFVKSEYLDPWTPCWAVVYFGFNHDFGSVHNSELIDAFYEMLIMLKNEGIIK